MKVALIGGTGFVGSYLVDELVANGHQPHLLVRPGWRRGSARRQTCTWNRELRAMAPRSFRELNALDDLLPWPNPG